ncbi:hypothetical protein PINS_up004362 [Pythium insidiosum]|nr:hypothetical protein PINS_up004362 [Pythium insidiosum]
MRPGLSQGVCRADSLSALDASAIITRSIDELSEPAMLEDEDEDPSAAPRERGQRPLPPPRSPASSTSGSSDQDHDHESDALSQREDEPGGASRTIAIAGCRVQLSNATQRLLSAAVLAPLITYFLWRSPVFATTTVCSVVVSVATFEYAWLAHRIHTRFVVQLERFEAARESNGSSTGSMSSSQSNGPTRSSDEDDGQQQQPQDDEPLEDVYEETVAFRGKRCAVSRLAQRWCCGNEWIVGAGLSCVGTVLSGALLALIMSKHEFLNVDFGGFRLYYSLISSFAAWFCACFTPDWRYAAIVMIQKEVFMLLTLYSMRCPINNFHCDDAVNPSTFLLCGVLAITLLRVLTAAPHRALRLALHLALDVLGFTYVIGTLFFIVSFVDLDREATYRKLVVALLYVVWAADSGAYVVGKIFDACRYRRLHPLAPHLSPQKDYEGTLFAVLFGVGAMFLSANLLHINGTIVEKLLFAAVAVVVGRVGDLFESLLKRAALVKDSGMLIPGHGGILDRIDALMFASIVFSRYFGAIVFPDNIIGQWGDEH